MKQRNRVLFRRLLIWLTVLTMLMGTGISGAWAAGGAAIRAGETDEKTLTPKDKEYEEGNVILHKQAERIGPTEWKVNVKVTIGKDPVEKRKLEVVFVLDCSGSMAWCADESHNGGSSHTHQSSCYGTSSTPSCGLTEHTHSFENDCYDECTPDTNSNHWYENYWGEWNHYGRNCLEQDGSYYYLNCNKTVHTHDGGCYKIFVCGENQYSHSDDGATPCRVMNAEGNWVTAKTRLQVATEAISTIANNLSSDTITFKYVIFSSRNYDNNANKSGDTKVVTSVSNLTPEGGTQMYHGIETGIAQFSNNDYKKVLVVLTDGKADDYASSAPSLNAFKNPNGTDGTVFTVGFAYANDVLAGIAGNGGSYVHAANADSLKVAFKSLEQSLTAMLEDPMGTSVDFEAGTMQEIQTANGVISESGDTIYWHPASDGLGTVANSTIEYSYTVNLSNEANVTVGMHEDVPLNKTTYFYYGTKNADGTSNMNAAEFPIPHTDYAYSSITTKWVVQNANGSTTNIALQNLQALNPEIKSNATTVEKVISDYSSATYIPHFEQPYDFAPAVIPITNSNNYYRYIGTTVTANQQQLDGLEDVDATQPVAYEVVHKYEQVNANELYVGGTKYMAGRDFATGDTFTFTLTAIDGAPMPTGSTNGVKTVTINPTSGYSEVFEFGKIVFQNEGTYTYKIQEQQGSLGHVVYDTAERTMVVTVTKVGTALVASYTVDDVENDPIRIINRLETGDLKIEKTEVDSYNEDHQDTEFSFVINAKNVSNRPLADTFQFVYYDADGKVASTESVTFTNGYATVKLKAGQSVVINGLPDGTTYTVTEDTSPTGTPGFTATATGNAGIIVANTQKDAAFSNTYKADGKYQFIGSKSLEGEGAKLQRDQFSFTVWDEDGKAVAHGTNTDDGTIFFDTMNFTHDDIGTKTYTITEDVGTQSGILYDRTEYTVTLNITDKGDGTLSIVPVLPEGEEKLKISFTNKYITGQLTVSKEVSGNMGNRYKEFPFKLETAGLAKLNVSTDGGTTFEEVTLTNGVYEFKLMHGQNIIFYPVAGEYTVTETDNGDYTTSYSLDGGEAQQGTSCKATLSDNGDTVKFVNNRNVGVPTGVDTPTSAALAGIVMAMALLAIVYIGRRWRILEE